MANGMLCNVLGRSCNRSVKVFLSPSTFLASMSEARSIRSVSTARRLDVRFLISSRDAGGIIGKKGCHIQSLRQKHKVTIQVPDCDGPERVLIVQGDYEASLAALLEIIPAMKENQRVPNDQNEIRLLAHQSQIGAVIGKGGERVRELRTKYNVGMKVFAECLPFSTERAIALRGRIEDVERCLREIFTLLEQTPARGQTIFYDPINYDQSGANEYGGFADATVSSPSSSSAPPTKEQIETTCVSIPNRFARVIIGPRGSKIAEIRQTSGATIQIDDATNENADRIITIRGTPSQINQAQYLLRTAVKESGLWTEN